MSDEVNSASANVGPGDKIAGYRLEEQVGQGGMAVVYRARDERLDRQVALKVLAPALTADPAFRARFIRESRAAAAVDHRHILPVYDTGDADGVMFIAMRYIAGGDVRTLFAGGQAMPPDRVWHIVSQVADALDEAHALKLVHRDVKPANILVDVPARSTSGRIDHVYLTDFGISMQGVASHLTSTGNFVGSLAYISPEQIEARPVQGYADQYSLACTAYEMLTGEAPFTGDLAIALINAQLTMSPPLASAKRPELPPAVDQVLAKALAKSPEQRYPTCCDFADDLGRALGVAPGTSSAASDPQATTSSANGCQPSVPTPTETTNPALPPSAATGPGQHQPQVGYGSVMPMPMPPWVSQVPVTTPSKRRDQAPHCQQTQQVRSADERPQNALIAALVTIVVVVLAAAGTVAFMATRSTAQSTTPPAPPPTTVGPSPTPIPTPTPTSPSMESQELDAMNSLLMSSASSLSGLQQLTENVGNCVDVESNLRQIEQKETEREAELTDAERLDVDAIPQGTTLQSDLVTALTDSVRADSNYIQWARQQLETGCAYGTSSSYWQAAYNYDLAASSDKTTFNETWTQVAGPVGYPSYPTF